jgi:DNA repair exonuclease SbcCD ATPase subunit
LIRGPNESGKSTVFEALFFGLFGQPLAAETRRGKLDNLIRYGAEEARVDVTVELPGRTLLIERTIRRGRRSCRSRAPRPSHRRVIRRSIS